MTDSPRPGWPPDSTSPYQGYSDPAYAGSTPYGPSYAPASTPSSPAPTEPLPQYWTQTYPPAGSMPPGDVPPPEPPRGPRPWVWALIGFAVATVIGLLLFMVFVTTNPSRQETSIPAMPSSTYPRTPPRTTTTTPELPSILPIPLPTLTLPNPTTSPNTSGETEPVRYEVTGQGRAINITYIDSGGVMQTEFNVLLPWSKEVNLPKPAQDSASITVINAGRDVTCKISIGGVEVQERSGALLTVCSPSG
ncbi:MAG: MmpS family transport accessory protein [Mycobacterium sp.]